MTVIDAKVDSAKRRPAAQHPLVIVNDDTCSLRYIDPPHTVEAIPTPIRPLIGTQVGAITWSLSTEIAYAWPSRLFENYYDNMARVREQKAAAAATETDALDTFRPMNESRDAILSLQAQGIDYLPKLIDEAHAAGLKFYGSFRMNDIHHRSEPEGPLRSTFWNEHQQYRLWDVRDARTYYNAALDYSFPEVRNRRLGMIRETLEWYDYDGVELDFCREPYLFPRAEAWQKRTILTDFVKEVRAELERAGQRRGKRLDLLMRVPLDSQKLRDAGMDVDTWVEQGLIDTLIMSSLLNDYNAVIEPWLSRCQAHGIPFYPSLEWNPVHNSVHNHMTIESVDEIIRRQRAAAQNFLSQGAAGIYIFNYPCLLYQVKRSVDEFRKMTSLYAEIGSAQELAGKPKQYVFWDQLPMQLESARPAEFYQTIRFQVRDPDLSNDGTRVDISFRQVVEANPHVSVYYQDALASTLPVGWVTYRLNGWKVPQDWIVAEQQSAGTIQSGFALSAHEKITLNVPPSAMRKGDNTLEFFIDRFPHEQDPYVHIYELLVDVSKS